MSVASLEAKLDRLKAEQKKLKKRKSAVEKIIKKLNKKPVDDVDDIKKGGKKTADYLEKGVDGIPHIDTIVADIRTSAKTAHKLDRWEEKTYFSKEVSRLASRIDALDREIAQVKAEIKAAREAERAAALAKLKDKLF